MRFYLFFICITLVCSGCRQAGDASGSAGKLSVFKGMPPHISGCACYFSSAPEAFHKERFLFVSDMDSTAYISVNNKLLPLKLQHSTQSDTTVATGNYTNTYSDGVYKLEVEVHMKNNTGDEAWWNVGELRLYFKDLIIDKRSIQGECGC